MSSHWTYGSSQTLPGLERVLPGLSLSCYRPSSKDDRGRDRWTDSYRERLTPPDNNKFSFSVNLAPNRSPPTTLQPPGIPAQSPKPIQAPATPARPTRQPPKSNFALWVGNLPPKPTLQELCALFGTSEMISVYLIHRTGCAFVNYATSDALDEAVVLFHQRGGKIREHKLVIKPQKKTATPVRSPKLEPTSCPSSNDRYFICKSLTSEDLVTAKTTQLWSTQVHNREKFNDAFRNCKNVYFIFSANRTSSFFGFARMTSLISDKLLDPIDAPQVDDTHIIPLPEYSKDGVEYPAGNIVEDATRGCLFWEAANQEHIEEAHEDIGSHWTAPCTLEWLSGDSQVLFSRTRQIRNPMNANKPVKVARDGTEVDPAVGKQLCELFGSR